MITIKRTLPSGLECEYHIPQDMQHLIRIEYPLPVDIGYVSLGQDYPGVVYIDGGDSDWPEMVWHLDCYCD